MAQIFEGLFKAKWDEASSDSESSDDDSDNESEAPLTAEVAKPLRGLQATVVSERVLGPSGKAGEFKTVATGAVEFDINVPVDHIDGAKISVPGPHGTIEVVPPTGAEPGKTVHLRLSPLADFRVTVPSGVSGGQTMFFEGSDKLPGTNSSKIAVKVPKDVKPGESFEITPPAVMVLVPKGAKTGETVVFQVKDQWCSAAIPEETECGHFAARLPKPREASSPKGGA